MDRESTAEKLTGLLDLKRKTAGIKLVSRGEYDKHDGTELRRPMHYCVAVRCALRGKSIKLNAETSACPGSNRALGFAAPAKEYFSGAHGRRMGLFGTEDTAAETAGFLPRIQPGAFGIVVKPLELFETDPDVVLIAADPRTVMRVLQGYAYSFGIPRGMHMSGNQAVCVECTATPMETGSVNVSMMCSGTRHEARWKDDDVMIGIPFHRLYDTVEGIEQTVNPVEPDDRKREIEERLEGTNLLKIEVEYGNNYYTKTE